MKPLQQNRWQSNRIIYLKTTNQPIILLLLSMLLAGCNLVSKPSPPMSVSSSVTLSPTTQQKITANVIPTFVPLTPTHSFNQQPPDIFEEELSSMCQTVSSDLSHHLLSGHLILFRESENKYTLFNLDSGEATDLNRSNQEELVGDFTSSPDGKWVVYTIYQKKTNSILGMIEPAKSILQNMTGQKIQWGKDNFGSIVGWIDNQYLLITRKNQPWDSTVALNPWIGTEEAFSLNDLPNIPVSAGASLYFFWHVNIMPDPSLQLMVYPRLESSGESYVALWDRQSKRVVEKLKDEFPYSGDPLWSPDGSNFIMAVATGLGPGENDVVHDIFQMNRAGEIIQLTHFENFQTWNRIWKASRSPDGRYLVFQVDYRSGAQVVGRYLVMDLRTNTVQPMCFDSKPSGANVPNNSPIWSPDSQYFVLFQLNQNAQSRVIIGNPQTGQSYRVNEDMIPTGWLVDP